MEHLPLEEVALHPVWKQVPHKPHWIALGRRKGRPQIMQVGGGVAGGLLGWTVSVTGGITEGSSS